MPQMMPIYWVLTLYSSLFIVWMMMDLFFYKNENFNCNIEFTSANKTLFKW